MKSKIQSVKTEKKNSKNILTSTNIQVTLTSDVYRRNKDVGKLDTIENSRKFF